MNSGSPTRFEGDDPLRVNLDAGLSWTSTIGYGLEARLALRRPKLDDRGWWRANTAQIQMRQLRRILSTAADTELGREGGFAKLLGLDDRDLLPAYRQSLPVRTYEGYRERIVRAREHGERDVFWPGLVQAYAQTSGTTAGDKFMPQSEAMFKSNYRASLDIFATMMRWGVSIGRLFGGQVLFLGGSSAVDENEHGVRTGDLSGLVMPLIHWPLTKVYSPGADIALMDDWPEKIEAMAQRTIDQDVRMISGMPSWSGVLLERLLALGKERGRKADRVRDLWPNFFVFVHGGVKYAPFKHHLTELIEGEGADDLPMRLELYPASEAFVAIQDEPWDPSLRLCADIGNFFEFVPIEEIESDTPTAHAAWEVEKGQRYVVVLTTCAGLCRYVLGDVVEFDTIPAGLDGVGGEGPCRLRIVGRHKLFINAFGENLIVEHIETAVGEAAAAVGVKTGEFTAGPVYPDGDTPAGLELVIESKLWGDAADRFRNTFDASLKQQNVDYTTKRTDSLGMAPPTVTTVPAGTFHRWMESRGKLGGQNKCPRCANHRDFVEGVVRIADGQAAGGVLA
ncbi:MAG: GH3 auxin-responsive promoter family protein [Planctomycetota bacterium]